MSKFGCNVPLSSWYDSNQVKQISQKRYMEEHACCSHEKVSCTNGRHNTANQCSEKQDHQSESRIDSQSPFEYQHRLGIKCDEAKLRAVLWKLRQPKKHLPVPCIFWFFCYLCVQLQRTKSPNNALSESQETRKFAKFSYCQETLAIVHRLAGAKISAHLLLTSDFEHYQQFLLYFMQMVLRLRLVGLQFDNRRDCALGYYRIRRKLQHKSRDFFHPFEKIRIEMGEVKEWNLFARCFCARYDAAGKK